MKSPLRVLLADDSTIALTNLRDLLSRYRHIQIVGQCGTPQSVLATVETAKPDVIVMDLVWFDDKLIGHRTIARLRRDFPTLKIVAITAYSELRQKAAQKGADLALEKGFSAEQLLAAFGTLFPNRKIQEVKAPQGSTLLHDSLVLLMLLFSVAAIFFLASNFLSPTAFVLAVPPVILIWSGMLLWLFGRLGILNKSSLYRLLQDWLSIARNWLSGKSTDNKP